MYIHKLIHIRHISLPDDIVEHLNYNYINY